MKATDSNTKKFPSSPRHVRSKRRLAKYFRLMADYVEGEAIESPPWAVVIVLTGDQHHEVLHVGHGSPAALDGALNAAIDFKSRRHIDTSKKANLFRRGAFEQSQDREPSVEQWARSGL